jgi:hypothetical protein
MGSPKPDGLAWPNPNFLYGLGSKKLECIWASLFRPDLKCGLMDRPINSVSMLISSLNIHLTFFIVCDTCI